MSAPEILIDGYNLLHAIGFRGKITEPGRLRTLRLRMLDRLADYLPTNERQKVLVVFDQGMRSRSKPDTCSRHQIRVQFASGYNDADEMIVELIRNHPSPQKLLVVSSDHRIQATARSRKATFIDSDDWIGQLESQEVLQAREVNQNRGSGQPSESHSGAQKPTPEDTEYWTDIFSDSNSDNKDTEKQGGTDPWTDDPLANPFPPGFGDELDLDDI